MLWPSEITAVAASQLLKVLSLTTVLATVTSELLKDQSRREEVSRDLQIASKRLGERDAYQESAKYISQFLSKE